MLSVALLLAVLMAAGPALPAPGELPKDLPIGPDDVLEIQVFQVPELNRTVRVDQKGSITLPLLGAVRAESLTPSGLEEKLAGLLAEKYLNNPSVSVFVREYKSRPVSVVGAVKLPGLYHIPSAKPLVEVIALAQGLADTPNAKAGNRILVTRGTAHPDAGQTVEASVVDVLHNNEAAAGILVYPGDQVRVLPAEFVYVLGDVERPGAYPLESHQAVNVLQALALAGGPQRTAKMKEVVIFRHDAAGKRTEIPVQLTGRMTGPGAERILAANDILFVPGSVTKRAFGRVLDLSLTTASGVVIWRR
ncbi:MAG: polysaccharide biosynthesis/export family protein [Bryobacterales bacterium]|nr:polysaccharide biosynthesis/export family protein [Bryobacterales bacterium]